MKIEHIAIYVKDLEATKNFYIKYFGATKNNKYRNPNTQLETYFLTFADGARLEIMTRPNLPDGNKELFRTGLIHLAFKIGTKELVDKKTAQLKSDGYKVISQPRTSGDGYYESCVADPEGNFVEIIA